jgi:hypothetical protein
MILSLTHKSTYILSITFNAPSDDTSLAIPQLHKTRISRYKTRNTTVTIFNAHHPPCPAHSSSPPTYSSVDSSSPSACPLSAASKLPPPRQLRAAEASRWQVLHSRSRPAAADPALSTPELVFAPSRPVCYLARLDTWMLRLVLQNRKPLRKACRSAMRPGCYIRYLRTSQSDLGLGRGRTRLKQRSRSRRREGLTAVMRPGRGKRSCRSEGMSN